MDLNLLLNKKPLECFESSIGNLCVFSMTYGSQNALGKYLDKNISNCEPEEYVRALFMHVCCLEKNLKEGEFKPDGTLLMEKSELDALKTEEIEEFARIYVKNNEYLFKGHEVQQETKEDGTHISSKTLDEIEAPKEEGESYISYLHRLSIRNQKKQDLHTTKLIKKTSAFSSGLTSEIAKNLTAGTAIKDAMERLSKGRKATDGLISLSHLNKASSGISESIARCLSK